jgi:hypothetical protein
MIIGSIYMKFNKGNFCLVIKTILSYKKWNWDNIALSCCGIYFLFEEIYFLGYKRHIFCLKTADVSGEHFDPEYGGDVFFLNVGWLSTDDVVLYPRW